MSEQRQIAWKIIANAWLRESQVSGMNITTKAWKLEGLVIRFEICPWLLITAHFTDLEKMEAWVKLVMFHNYLSWHLLGRDANLWDHRWCLPKLNYLVESYWADMLSSEIIVILYTDIACEIITCQATCNTNSMFSRSGSKSQVISMFCFTC